MKHLKRMTAVLLAVIMVSLAAFESMGASVPAGPGGSATAPPEGGSGATDANKQGDAGVTKYDPGCSAVFRPAWLVFLQRVDNTQQGRATYRFDSTNVRDLAAPSECKASAVAEMRLSYPEGYTSMNNDFLSDQAFIVVNKGSASFNVNDVRIYRSDGSVTSPVPVKETGNGSAPQYHLNCVSDDILNGGVDFEESGRYLRQGNAYAFIESYMTYRDYSKSLGNVVEGGVSLEDAQKNFYAQFRDIGGLAGRINNAYGSVFDVYPEDMANCVRNSLTLDLIAVIAESCREPKKYEDMVSNYIDNQNRDGSDSFVVPVIVAGFVCNNANGNEHPMFFSLPTYYKKAYGVDPNKLFYPEDNGRDRFGDYDTNGSAFENAVYDFLHEDGHKQSGQTYYTMREGSWWSYGHASTSMTTFSSQARTCMPTDIHNKRTGNIGYTFFAYGGAGAEPGEGIGQFVITATTDQNNVTQKGADVAALINIDLKCSDKQINEYRDVFMQEELKGHDKADIIIRYSLEKLKGDGSSAQLLDKVFTAGAQLTNSSTVTLPGLTFDKLKEYLQGGKLIQAADAGIIVNDPVTNRYIASVDLKFPGGKQYSIYGKGKDDYPEDDEFKSSDKVSWNAKEDSPDGFHYYSQMGKPRSPDNYVEIKEGKPGNEHYEAMAGVPTTEDLYVGFGATEFMNNFEGKLKRNGTVTRTYSWSYTAPQCIEDDEKCIIEIIEHSCAHTKTVPGPNGTSVEVDDTRTFPCGGSCGVCGGNGGCPGDTHSCTHKTGDVGVGCKATQKINNAHPHSHTWTGKVNQEIAPFTYLDIEANKLWMLDKVRYQGNSGLLTNPAFVLDPKLGYVNFTKEGNFKHGNNPQSGTDGNGRLVFFVSGGDQKVNNENIYGNTDHVCGTNGDGQTIISAKTKREELSVAAWTAINSCISQNSKVYCTVVSDYIAYQTSEGWQIPCYYSYDSDAVNMCSGQFDVTDANSQSALTGNPITFSHERTLAEMWQNNPDCASKWEPTHPTRSGYNGHYNTPGSKWDNVNVTKPDSYADKTRGSGSGPKTANYAGVNGWNKLAQAVGYECHPNSTYKVGSSSYAQGFSNLRLTKTGLDIKDVMATEDRTWPSQEARESRVRNGEWDTGKGETQYVLAVDLPQNASTGGTDFSEYQNWKEVGYTQGKTKINNIVVHNPVSTQNAYVLCNDKKYDLRSAASLAEGGDPGKASDVCPGDAGCQYQKLICPIHAATVHTDDCYVTAVTTKEHIGGLNKHEHTAACNGTYHSDITMDLPAGFYSFTIQGGQGGRDAENDGQPGDRVSGTLTLGSAASVRIVVGKSGSEGGNAAGGYPDGYRSGSSGSSGSGGGSTTVYVNGANVAQAKGGDGGTLEHVWGHGGSYDGAGYGGGTTAWNAAYVTGASKGSGSGGSGYAMFVSCSNVPNAHQCTSACKEVTQKVLTCTDPHHIVEGQQWGYNSASSHYEYGDDRCWEACHDDNNHKKGSGTVVVNGGTEIDISDTFINIDRLFQIYYPDTGDFAESPSLHGILDTTSVRGMGYTDGMDTSRWTRDKYVVFPVSVLYRDASGELTKQASAGQPINLNYVPSDASNKYTWTFYAVLANNEQKNSGVKFVSIASNAATVKYYEESSGVTNKDRVDGKAARHTATKKQVVDVLGSIGGLTLEDTGDFRFATLFKKSKGNGKWLIQNLVPEVNLSMPNKVVADDRDVRNETVSAETNWHDTYGTQYMDTGGKAYEQLLLPLVPRYNPVKALRNQPMRPGYNLYMDISTIGNYYGENVDDSGAYVDNDLYYKMTVTPRYWALDLDDGEYTPLDVYMGKNTEYKAVAYFDCEGKESRYYLYLDWLANAARRNYTKGEKNATGKVVDAYTSGDIKLRTPSVYKDPLGTAQRLHLNDLNRTFIGSTETYGADTNPENAIYEAVYNRQAQRWHWTIGLPSSSVFVEAGKPCTDANIKAIRDKNAVIVCSLDIKVRGTVWTLEYDGSAINNNNGGIQPYEGGKVYPPPTDPETGEPLKDPIVTVYTNKFTSADDLRTEGSH